MIISGGVNIYPAETEAVLIEHPKVADVAVFGIPDDDWGEEVKAAVSLLDPSRRRGAGGGADRVLPGSGSRSTSARGRSTSSPTARDPNGKVYKRRLRDPYWEGRESAIVCRAPEVDDHRHAVHVSEALSAPHVLEYPYSVPPAR
jgi:long-chain acyl-CoA synthetase